VPRPRRPEETEVPPVIGDDLEVDDRTNSQGNCPTLAVDEHNGCRLLDDVHTFRLHGVAVRGIE
jgi:hypothetical protein